MTLNRESDASAADWRSQTRKIIVIFQMWTVFSVVEIPIKHSSLFNNFFFFMFRYKDDPWLWEMDWSVQEIRTKKLKTPKTVKRRTKSQQTAFASDEKCSDTDKHLTEEFITDLVGEDEVPHDNNIEVVEGLKNSSDILATIPPAVDVMYKRRQNLPGYPK